MKTDGETKKTTNLHLQDSQTLLYKAGKSASAKLMQKVLGQMNHHDVFEVAQQDWLITHFGNFLYTQHGR